MPKRDTESFHIPILSEGTLPNNLDTARIIGSRKILTIFPGFSGRALSLRSVRSLIWSATPKKILLESIALSIVFMFSISAIPLCIQWGIDKAVIPTSLNYLWINTIFIILLGLGSAISFSTFGRLITYRKLTASYLISTAISEQSMRLGRSLRSKISAGEVISVGSSDVQRLTGMTMVLTRVLGLLQGTAYSSILLAQCRWLYGYIAIATAIITMIAVTPFLIIIHRREHEYRTTESEQTGRSGDIVSGLRILAGIGGMDVFEETFTDSANRTRKAKLRASIPWIAVDTIILGTSSIMVTIITYLAYGQVINHHSSIGSYSQVVAQASIYAGHIWTYVEIFLIFIHGRVSAERLLSFLRITPDIIDGEQTVAAPAIPSAIHDAQSNITIEPGKLTVIIAQELGSSTAIARRLARVVPDVNGVTWGYIPLGTIPLAEIRQRIVFSDNDDHLFTGTLLSNITMGRLFSEANIEKAMYASASDELLEILDNGLESHIREKALNLSGGQRQRVRLARALLFNPEILLLIDPTSAVDAHVEMIIARRLATYRKENPNFSTVIVSNSPHIATHADTLIIVDRHGNILDSGPRERIAETDIFSKIVHRREHNFENHIRENAPVISSDISEETSIL